MKKMNTMARQGDVLLVNEKHLNLRPETRKRFFNIKYQNKVDFQKENRIPLAYGEVTGHAHAIYNKEGVDLLYNKDIAETQKMLEIQEGTNSTLQHEEHEAIELVEGRTVVLGQFEWRLEKIVKSYD